MDFFFNFSGTKIISALITTIWQQIDLPVGITEYGHNLIHNGRINYITVGYQHFVNLTGCCFPYLWGRSRGSFSKDPESCTEEPSGITGTGSSYWPSFYGGHFVIFRTTVYSCLWQQFASGRDLISSPQGNSCYYSQYIFTKLLQHFRLRRLQLCPSQGMNSNVWDWPKWNISFLEITHWAKVWL